MGISCFSGNMDLLLPEAEGIGAIKVSLKSITRIYIQRIRPKARAELDWFQRQASLVAAVEHAALAINSNGKRYSHQRRLKRVTLEKAKQILLANIRAIARSQSFDDLFDLIQALLDPLSGVGELYIYDTSLRIGAKLNLLPSKVYLHAGTRIGARALGLDGRAKALEVLMFPPEFQQLEPHEIEDVLCIFKDELEAASVKQLESKIIKRSWCS